MVFAQQPCTPSLGFEAPRLWISKTIARCNVQQRLQPDQVGMAVPEANPVNVILESGVRSVEHLARHWHLTGTNTGIAHGRDTIVHNVHI
jgi:hypothetical protein